MSGAKFDPNDGGDKAEKRNLPSWMASKDKTKKSRGNSSKNGEDSSVTSTSDFSKLLEGVVFVLSGFVNPERGELRSQAMEMGSEYRSDWSSDCTLLVCAFPSTPKFRQVEADSGTIVSKEWISECYNQKKLVEIEPFLMHAGKPWRKNRNSGHIASLDQKNSSLGKSHKRVERKSHQKVIDPKASKDEAPSSNMTNFPSSRVQDWAIHDLNNTISWLQNQEEAPEPGELGKIAVEGILTCLQDTIEAVKQNEDVLHVTEMWKFVPRVVKELARSTKLRSKKELVEQAMACKRIYEEKFQDLENSSVTNKKLKSNENGEDDDEKTEIMTDSEGPNTDETVDMPEEEVNMAFERIKAKQKEW